jgi:hypothetical protein
MSKKLEEFKEIKSLMDDMAPVMDRVFHKMNKLKQEANHTRGEFKLLDQNMKKILENFAKALSKNIAGGFVRDESFRKNQNQILVDAMSMMFRAGRNL